MDAFDYTFWIIIYWRQTSGSMRNVLIWYQVLKTYKVPRKGLATLSIPFTLPRGVISNEALSKKRSFNTSVIVRHYFYYDLYIQGMHLCLISEARLLLDLFKHNVFASVDHHSSMWCAFTYNTLKPGQNVPRFADVAFKLIFFRCKCLYFCSLQWLHNDRNGVSNHQSHDCLLKRLFRRRSQKTSKLRVTGLGAGNHTGDRWIPRKNGQ